MNQTFRIIIVGVLSCLSLGVKAADLFVPGMGATDVGGV